MNGDDATERIRLPDGARDVLPVERGELRALEAGLRAGFASFGYLEVRTPLLEFADEMDRAQDGGVGAAFRLFDDHGRVLVLRPDLTIPVTRLVASRFPDHVGPVRVSYVGARLRPAKAGRAMPIEEQQAGAELVGLAGPAADAEIVALIVHVLKDLGIDDLRVAIGHVGLTRSVLDGVGVPPAEQARLQHAALTRDLAGWRAIAETLDLAPAARELVAALPTRRGDEAVVEELGRAVPSSAGVAMELCDAVRLLRDYGVREAAMIDLGVLRDWDYYSGLVFEVYAPGVERPVGAGGRYDTLGARFGVDRPAVGGGVWLDGLHKAVNARTALPGLRAGIVLIGGLQSAVTMAMELRARGFDVVSLPDGADGEALAAADGWRWVARPTGDRIEVRDRTAGTSVECTDIMEVLRSPAS